MRPTPGPGERGSGVVWLLLLVPALFLFAALVLDGGRVVTARQEAANLAEQAARLAVDRTDPDLARPAPDPAPAGAVAAGCGYVTAAAPAASCSGQTGADGRVAVRVWLPTRTALLAAVGIDRITVEGHGTARPAIGATTEVTP